MGKKSHYCMNDCIDNCCDYKQFKLCANNYFVRVLTFISNSKERGIVLFKLKIKTNIYTKILIRNSQ